MSDQSISIATYSNRDLSIHAITDQQWIVDNYSQVENDTFIYRKFFEKTLTLVRNQDNILPIQGLADSRFKMIHWGDYPTVFAERLAYYTPFETAAIEDFDWKTITQSDKILLVINKKEIQQNNVELLNQISRYRNQIILINLEEIENLVYFSNLPSILQAYESNAVTEDWAAQMVFGGIQAKGALPVSLSGDFLKGLKNASTPIIRFSYMLPKAANMNAEKLGEIEKIMTRAIRKKATPGGQIIAVKSGKVIYYESFGHFTYDKIQPVDNLNLYDLASITKASATTLATMKLYEEGLLDTESQLKQYVTQSEKSPSRNLKIRHLLTHRSGLSANAPIAKYVRIKDTVSTTFKAYFANHNSKKYSVKIAENRYMNQAVQRELWREIYKIRPARKQGYLYSDVNFAIMQNVNESISGKSLDDYLNHNIYNPLGVHRLLFNPLRVYQKHTIVPTILDKKWRHKILQGEVHDETAALLGGVGGNAGLFGNANDLAVIYEMLLNQGTYGGEKIFEPKTIEHFIYKRYSGHRGLGFDRKGAGCYASASKLTFGHSGYTGTCVWADPKNDLIYVFLSNRVHPDPKNKRLIALNTRTLVHRAIYKAIN